MIGPVPAELVLHIDGSAAEKHAVPAAVLVQILSNFQRAAELVGMHVEGKGIKDRARVPAVTSRKFRLLCKLPHEGSYALPVSFGDPTTDLLASMQIHNAWNLLIEAIKSVHNRNVDIIRSILPDTAFRTRVLDAIRGMAPSPGAGWVLQLLQRDGSALAELDERTGRFIDSAINLSEQKVTKETITGELRSIDFSARRLAIIHPVTNRVMNCYYDDAVEDLLYENRRQLIQVTGRVLLDDAGQPKEIVEVSDIKDVDLSPFELDRVQAENIRLKVKSKIILEPTLDETSQFMCLEHDEIGIMVYGKTRENLREDLHAQIAMMWQEYALARNEELTDDAIERKNYMLDMFTEIKDAAQEN